MKRLVDVVLSLLGVLILLPLGLVAAVLIRLTSPGPIFFRQERLGRGGNPFSIYKFRTMTVQAVRGGSLVTAAGDSRITAVGRFLRRHKIDELPQLFNVLRGEMSLVGPRPEVVEFAELYPLEYARILQVRPGITHPATLRYRREEGILAAARHPSLFYAETLMPAKLAAYEADLKQSLAADLRTIIATVVPDLVPWWAVAPFEAAHFGLVPAPGSRFAHEIRPARTVSAFARPAPGHYLATAPDQAEMSEQRQVAAV